MLIYPGESALSNQFDNRLRVVPHSVPHRSICFWFLRDSRSERNSSARENHLTREKATRHVSPFLAWGDFHARSGFARSTIPEEKWRTSRSLLWQPCPEWSSDQAPVVQTLDKAIHRLNHYPAGKYLEINCVIHKIGLSISSATGVRSVSPGGKKDSNIMRPLRRTQMCVV